MSTFLVTLTIVILAIAGAMAVAIKDPNQPATLRPQPGRVRRPARAPRAHRPPRAPARPAVRQPAMTRVVTVPASQEATVGHFTDHWTKTARTRNGWLRLRSGVVLTVLLAVVGTLVAMSIAGVVVLLALALRSAVS